MGRDMETDLPNCTQAGDYEAFIRLLDNGADADVRSDVARREGLPRGQGLWMQNSRRYGRDWLRRAGPPRGLAGWDSLPIWSGH